METGTSKKTHSVLPIVIAVVLVIGVAASCTLGALAVRRIAGQAEQITELSDTLASVIGSNSNTVTQEDDVAVGGEYYIRSTLPISDAYKSGDTSGLSEKQLETLEMASDVLDGIITDGMTPYEQEKAVYGWMCANLGHEGGVTVVVPTASEYSAEPYGVLKYGTAVCVGYATTFRLFMQMLGIDCMVVHNSYHSWNLVNLDGDWYHTDIYSDVGTGNYANFNMNDEMCSNGHEWDTSFFPAATGLKYCYAYQSASQLDDVYTLPGLVRAAVDSGTLENLYFLIDSTDKTSQQALSEMLGRLGDAVMQYGTNNGRDMYMDYNMQLVQGQILLSVLLTEYTYDDEPDVNLTDKDYVRIDEAMQDAFGDVYIPGDGYDDGYDDGYYETYNAEVAV